MCRAYSISYFTYNIESVINEKVPFRFWHFMLHVRFLVTWREGAAKILFLTSLLFVFLFSSVVNAASIKEPDNKETYADWVVECYNQTASKAKCQVYQRILFNGGQSVALVVTMTPKLENQDSLMQIALPLGIRIPSGASIQIDQNYKIDVAIDHCTNRGCIIEDVTPDNLINVMHNGQKATVSVTAENGSPFNIPLSLTGFKEAYNRLVTVSK